MKKAVIGSLLLVGLLVGGTSTADTAVPVAENEVAAQFNRLVSALNAKDASAWASFYSTDGFQSAIAGSRQYATRHTPFLSTGSTCVDTLGIDYLIRLNRPETDVSCPYVAPLQ